MASYKLTYFDGRGIGESIRWLFMAAEVDFVDCRIPLSEWPSKKPEINPPWGQLPFLEVDGKRLAQSTTILKYLGNTFKLAGVDEWEQAKCDEIAYALQDFFGKVAEAWNIEDPEKKKNILTKAVEVDAPVYLERFDSVLATNKSGYFVGNNLTWADITAAATLNMLELTFDIKLVSDKTPNLAKLMVSVQNIPRIKQWLAVRPKTIL